MALVKCADCGKTVSASAVSCPNCGRPIAANLAAKAAAAKSRPNRAVFALIVGGLLLALVIAIAASQSGRSSSSAATSPETPAQKDSSWEANGASTALYAAFQLCQEAVTRNLKAPSTAKFADYYDSYAKETSRGHYHLQLKVDAQNGFGAMLRNTFDCRVTRNIDRFQITSLESLE